MKVFGHGERGEERKKRIGIIGHKGRSADKKKKNGCFRLWGKRRREGEDT